MSGTSSAAVARPQLASQHSAVTPNNLQGAHRFLPSTLLEQLARCHPGKAAESKENLSAAFVHLDVCGLHELADELEAHMEQAESNAYANARMSKRSKPKRLKPKNFKPKKLKPTKPKRMKLKKLKAKLSKQERYEYNMQKFAKTNGMTPGEVMNRWIDIDKKEKQERVERNEKRVREQEEEKERRRVEREAKKKCKKEQDELRQKAVAACRAARQKPKDDFALAFG